MYNALVRLAQDFSMQAPLVRSAQHNVRLFASQWLRVCMHKMQLSNDEQTVCADRRPRQLWIGG